MPDWNVLLGDLTAVQLVLWVVAAILLIGLVIKLWPFIKNSVAIVDALVALPATSKRVEAISTDLSALTEKVDGIHHETHKNDGSSIKDAVGRVEEGVAGLYEQMVDVKRDLGETKSQITKLAATDDELWASIESTHPSETTMSRRALRAARERRTITGDDIPT